MYRYKYCNQYILLWSILLLLNIGEIQFIFLKHYFVDCNATGNTYSNTQVLPLESNINKRLISIQHSLEQYFTYRQTAAGMYWQIEIDFHKPPFLLDKVKKESTNEQKGVCLRPKSCQLWKHYPFRIYFDKQHQLQHNLASKQTTAILRCLQHITLCLCTVCNFIEVHT